MRIPPAARLPLLLSLPLEDLACAVLLAFFAMQGSIPGLSPAQAHEITGSVPTAFTTFSGISAQLAVNAILLVLLIRFPRLILRTLTAAPAALLIALLAVASTAWSLDPLLTLRRSIPFALAALFGLWFAGRYPLRRQLAILRVAVFLLALATVLLILLNPALGLDPTPGHASDWRGVFTQKNACGRIMALGSAAVLFDESVTARRLIPLALFLVVLVLSGSRAAWMMGAALIFLWLFLRAGRRAGPRIRTVLALAAPLAVILLAAAASLSYRLLIPLLGRDESLSGRTAIWPEVLHAVARRPLFGFGFDAFWRGMQGPSLDIDRSVHFIVEHAHNGFLEICLELGAAGLCLFLLSWFSAWLRLWPLWRRGSVAPIAFPLAFLILIALYDIDENTLLIYNGLFWPLYVATLANIHHTARDQGHRLPPGPHAILIPGCDNTRASGAHPPGA